MDYHFPYASVCSGAEAFGPNWHALGYEPVFHAEIDRHASAVLRYRYPGVPNYDDFTRIATEGGPQPARPVRLLCGGTPCQSFSPAGLRQGLASARGMLALEFIKLAQRLGVKWILWENVPGVLSADGGRAFGSFLGALAECGYGFAYRVLDLQYWGVPQRRKRVFVVACLGDWRAAAAVLFEPESLRGDSAPGRPAAADSADAAATCTGVDGWPATVTATLDASFGRLQGHDRQHAEQGASLFVPVAYQCHGGSVGPMGVLRAGNGSMTGGVPFMDDDEGVRRLTPRECERLMGWADDWTRYGINAKGKQYELADGPRYRICGNGWGVPVVTWIAARIRLIDELLAQ